MPIVIISADDGSVVEGIARKVAEEMNCSLLNLEVLDEIGPRHGQNPQQLREALLTVPSRFSSRAMRTWRQELACIEGEVLERMLEDNVVCQGLSAHLYVQGVSHAMKVRVLTGGGDDEEGPEFAAKRRERAELHKSRKRWSKTAYGRDETRLARYDLIINLGQIHPDEAVESIAHAAAFRKFQVMTYSIKCLRDLAMSAQVTGLLLETMTDIKVESQDGSVIVTTRASRRNKRHKISEIKEIAGKVRGVKFVEVHVKNNLNPMG